VIARTRRVLIAGASIAGPVLAYWLSRAGYQVTIVELHPEFRQGGHGVDVREQAIDVATRMGLMDAVRGAVTGLIGTNYVDRGNRILAKMDVQALQKAGNGAAEINRSSLARMLYETTRNDVAYIFGDTIRAIDQDAGGVDVCFERGPPHRFDLVIGADGIHSNVRKLAFGTEEQFLKFKHHYFAAASGGTLRAEMCRTTIYSEPGRAVLIQRPLDGRSMMFFVFRREQPLSYDHRDLRQQRRLIREAFANAEWEAPGLLDQADLDPNFYFDTVSQVVMQNWSRGRVAFVGDAAYCASPFSGAGALLAMVGAYRLAGELSAAREDHVQAFANYEAGMRTLVAAKQGHLFTGLMLPKSRLGISIRNTLLRSPMSKLAFGLQPIKIEPLLTYEFKSN